MVENEQGLLRLDIQACGLHKLCLVDRCAETLRKVKQQYFIYFNHEIELVFKKCVIYW